MYSESVVVVAPTIQYLEEQGCWEVQYGGMIRRHAQEWQCRVWFEMALAMYALSATALGVIPSQTRPTAPDSQVAKSLGCAVPQ
jgi:hypothetical protein